METQIGLELCTSGTIEKISTQGKFIMEKGTLMIISPLFPMLETKRSADYTSITLYEDMDKLLPLITHHQPPSYTFATILPFLALNAEQYNHFFTAVEQIRQKEQQLIDVQNPVERHVKKSIVMLSKQQILLEHALLFFLQMPHGEQEVSHRRQVLVRFLVNLNQQFFEQRSVSYYAAQASMTPRHFADIIKQESGYTPIEWIGMFTISQAKNMLRQSETPVKEVAAALGFPEQFTFRKYFKARTGMSPTEFKKQQVNKA